jgi:hypothetical protein
VIILFQKRNLQSEQYLLILMLMEIISATKIQGLGEGSLGVHYIHDHRYTQVKTASLKEALRNLMPRLSYMLLFLLSYHSCV